jgi:peptide/nickel transport system substrate-binding protein
VDKQAGQPGNQLLYFNMQKKPFDDLRVRRAIAHAINQQDIVDKAYFSVGATPSTSHMMKSFPQFYDPTVSLPAHDPKMAEQLLDDAGLAKGADGIRLRANITFISTIDTDRRSAEVVRDNLKDVGITVDLQPREIATVGKEVYMDANFDLHNVQVTSRGDPAIGMDRWYNSNAINIAFGNGSRYSNSELDMALNEGATNTEPTTRRAAYVKMQQILARDLPAYPLVDRDQWDFARPEVGGVFQAQNFYYRMDALYTKK